MSEQTVNAQVLAERFLREELAEGPRHGAELVELAKTRGISPSTLAAAKRSISVVSRRESWGAKHSGNGRWVWELDPAKRRAELRERLVDYLHERVEGDLQPDVRAGLKRILDQLAREGLSDGVRAEPVCRACGEAFTPNRKTQVYCSRSCQQRGKRG